MVRNWMRLSTAGLVAAALWTAGCSDVDTPTDLSLSPGSRQATLLTDATGRTYRAVKEDPRNDKTREGWAIFESHLGGDIYVAGGHRLRIPRHAVSRQTLWRMQVFQDGQVRAVLTAHQRDAEGNFTINVGPNGFQAPVEVTLSYKGADEITDPRALKVLWLKDDAGSVEGKTTVVDAPGQKVRTLLHHFSDYLLAMP